MQLLMAMKSSAVAQKAPLVTVGVKIRRVLEHARLSSPWHLRYRVSDPLPRAERGSAGVLPRVSRRGPSRRSPPTSKTWSRGRSRPRRQASRCSSSSSCAATPSTDGSRTFSRTENPPSPSSRTSPTPRAASSRGTSSCASSSGPSSQSPTDPRYDGPTAATPMTPAAFAAEVQKSEWNKDDRDDVDRDVSRGLVPAAAHFAPRLRTRASSTGPETRFATVAWVGSRRPPRGSASSWTPPARRVVYRAC